MQGEKQKKKKKRKTGTEERVCSVQGKGTERNHEPQTRGRQSINDDDAVKLAPGELLTEVVPVVVVTNYY